MSNNKKHPLIGKVMNYCLKGKVVTGVIVDCRPSELLDIHTLETVKGVSFRLKKEDGRYIWTIGFPETSLPQGKEE